MATAKALELIGKGITDATSARAETKGRHEVQLTQADVRRLLLIDVATTSNPAVLSGLRLQRLGRAEQRLLQLARDNGVTPQEMLAALRDTAEVSEELLAAVAAGQADPAEALSRPAAVEQAVALDAKDQADAQTSTQLTAAEQAMASLPEPVLAKFAETLKAFGSAQDRDPALAVLGAAARLSKAGQYALASALLQLD